MLLEPHENILPKEKAQIEIQKQIEAEYKLIGQMRLIPGLVLYEFNFDKMELSVANVIDTKCIKITSLKKTENKKVNFNPKSYYFQAHCRRTAIKKMNKIILKTMKIKDYLKN